MSANRLLRNLLPTRRSTRRTDAARAEALDSDPTRCTRDDERYDDYHVARPHGILAETSMNAAVHASPRRLTTWVVGLCKDVSRPPLHADKRPMVASQSIARDLVTAIARRRQAAS